MPFTRFPFDIFRQYLDKPEIAFRISKSNCPRLVYYLISCDDRLAHPAINRFNSDLALCGKVDLRSYAKVSKLLINFLLNNF